MHTDMSRQPTLTMSHGDHSQTGQSISYKPANQTTSNNTTMTTEREILLEQVRANRMDATACLRACATVPHKRKGAAVLLYNSSELMHEAKTYITDDPATMEGIKAELAVQQRLIKNYRHYLKVSR